MEALNSKEKTIALVKFLGVFLVLIVIVIWGIYYDYYMPTEERDTYKREYEKLKGSTQNQNDLRLTMDSLFAKIKRLDNPAGDDMMQQNNTSNITTDLNHLNSLANSDTVTMFGKIAQSAYTVCGAWFFDKRKLNRLGDAKAAAAEKDEKIKELKEDNDKNEQNIERLQLQLKICTGNN